MWLILFTGLLFAILLVYWLLISTEGVFLGRRVVVWLYDKTAHRYDNIKEFDPDWESFFIATPLMHQLRNTPASMVLDVATGTGRVPALLLEQPTFHGKVYGLDASWKMLEIGREKLRKFPYRSILIQQTVNTLPFPDHSFDAVTCLEALEFFPSDRIAIREMVRVLKIGGILMVTRRRGWEGKLFLSRYRDVNQFEDFLIDLGLEAVNSQPWQYSYDQVYGRKS